MPYHNLRLLLPIVLLPNARSPDGTIYKGIWGFMGFYASK